MVSSDMISFRKWTESKNLKVDLDSVSLSLEYNDFKQIFF